MKLKLLAGIVLSLFMTCAAGQDAMSQSSPAPEGAAAAAAANDTAVIDDGGSLKMVPSSAVPKQQPTMPAAPSNQMPFSAPSNAQPQPYSAATGGMMPQSQEQPSPQDAEKMEQMKQMRQERLEKMNKQYQTGDQPGGKPQGTQVSPPAGSGY